MLPNLFTDTPGDGLRLTTRTRRYGGTIMYPSTIVTEYSIMTLGGCTFMDQYTGLTQGTSYRVKAKLIDIDFDKSRLRDGEGDRFETVADWRRSMYEWVRQAKKINSTNVVDILRKYDFENYKQSFLDIFIDNAQAEADFLLRNGDWSIAQGKRYAALHADSSVKIGDFEGKYGQLLLDNVHSERKIRFLLTDIKDLLLRYSDLSFIKQILSDKVAIKSTEIVHALRSRPGVVRGDSISVKDGTIRVDIGKYRDRAPGGPRKIGQKYIAVYKVQPVWHNFKQMLGDQLRKIGLDIPVLSPFIHGAEAYVDFLSRPTCAMDISTADKYLPILIFTENKVDHGIANLKYPLQVISGGGPTTRDNILGMKMLTSCISEKDSVKIHGYNNSGDNVAFYEEFLNIPDLLEPTERYVGVNAEIRGIGGRKLNVDGQGKSLPWKVNKKSITFKRTKFSLQSLLQFVIMTNYFRDDSFNKLMKYAMTKSELSPTIAEGLPISMMDEEEFAVLVQDSGVVRQEYIDWAYDIAKAENLPIIEQPVRIQQQWSVK